MDEKNAQDTKLPELERKVRVLEQRQKYLIIALIVAVILYLANNFFVRDTNSSMQMLSDFDISVGTASVLATKDGGRLYFSDYRLTAIAGRTQTPSSVTP